MQHPWIILTLFALLVFPGSMLIHVQSPFTRTAMLGLPTKNYLHSMQTNPQYSNEPEYLKANFFLRKKGQKRISIPSITESSEDNHSNDFKSGFVSIIGNPNVGKSTLLNAILGENISITSYKPQTTRHRIFGVFNDNGSQIILSDSPGLLEPIYPLQKTMLDAAKAGAKDADVILMITDVNAAPLVDTRLDNKLSTTDIPMIIVVNKMDVLLSRTDPKLLQEELLHNLTRRYPNAEHVVFISALHGLGVNDLLDKIKDLLTLGPKYYMDDRLSTHSERFHSSEIIREAIFEIYKEEIPYCSHVRIDGFKDIHDELSTVDATICVSRKSQKLIIEGHNKWTLNKLRSLAKKKLEVFLHRKIYLTLQVEVDEDWRMKDESLSRFGYKLK